MSDSLEHQLDLARPRSNFAASCGFLKARAGCDRLPVEVRGHVRTIN
jgi:hypothetical protein